MQNRKPKQTILLVVPFAEGKALGHGVKMKFL